VGHYLFNQKVIKLILIVAAIILALLLIPNRVTYTAVEDNHIEAKTEVNPQTTREHINALIATYSARYGVSEALMHTIIKAESTYQPEAIGDKGYYCKKTGQITPSYGLAQINLCFHPVTVQQAHTPEFAIEFLAKKLARGECYLWSTCPYKRS
jgi:soluble lytic murein transglycosylase-like protein